ncbi:hypothetical protein GCM10020218_008630 [Dactylosporangium vinaceum]|uniref:Epoxide hydrolase n=1 Tax=Dactylosporangium vinaceum TaxID=53362 RepID=A0ABV5M3H1_9ACTN|nr:hypothetical protein [Dactylosporangium vinaceum]
MTTLMIDLARRVHRSPGRAAVRVLCAAVLVTPAAVALPAAAAPALALLPAQTDRPIPGVALAALTRPADPAAAAAARTAARGAPAWPAGSTQDVDLRGADASVRTGGLTVSLGRTDAVHSATAAPGRVRLTVLDQQATAAAGVRGAVLRLERTDGSAAAAPSRVSIDYAPFATGYGADWASRLRRVQLPDGDSPAGLAAWIVEKLVAWSGESSFTPDQFLTWVTAYWVTGTIGTSFATYTEPVAIPDRIETPTVLSAFPHDIKPVPRSYAEAFLNVCDYVEHRAGGHFAAWEQPQTYADDVRRAVKLGS